MIGAEVEQCRVLESVCLGEILTSDLMNNISLWFVTRSLLKETGTLESQLEANKVSSICLRAEDNAGIMRSARKMP